MHRCKAVLTTATVATAVVLLTTAALFGPVSDAHACDPSEWFDITPAVLAAQSLDELHAPDGELAQLWRDQTGRAGPAAIVGGVSQDLTIADSRLSADTYGSAAKVTAAVARWGTARDEIVNPYHVPDQSSCEGAYGPPPIGEFWWRATADGTPYLLTSTADPEAVAAHLTKLFGEPERFRRQPRLEQLLSERAHAANIELYGDSLVESQMLDPNTGEIMTTFDLADGTADGTARDAVALDEPPIAAGVTAADAPNDADGAGWLILGVGLGALPIAVLGVFALRSRGTIRT